MIKEALQYIVGLSEANIKEVCGQKYSDKELKRISYNPKAETIRMCTLTSLVEYLQSGADSMQAKMFVHVVSPVKVRLISQLDKERVRETLVEAVCDVPEFNYGHYIGHEEFLIALQAKFLPNNDRELLFKFAGTVENGTIAQYGDDGVTQKATVKTGIVSKGDAIVPNPVKLRPYRTFIEVKQPESEFIFRMKENERGGVQCAVFEADGGAWRNEAMENIKEYLQHELEKYKQYIVIS